MDLSNFRSLAETHYDFAVSYSSGDRGVVEPIAEGLRARGYRVFEYLDDIARAWGTELQRGLDQVFSGSAALYVLFLSPRYWAGKWTRYEFERITSSLPRGTTQDIVAYLLEGAQDPPVDARLALRRLGKRSIEEECDFLARKLADVEALPDADPGPATCIVSGTSLRTIDAPLLRRSLGQRWGSGERLSFTLRLPPFLSHAIVQLCRRLDEGIGAGLEESARDRLKAAVDGLSAIELPRLSLALGELIRRGEDAWSTDETCSAIRCYFGAECLRIFRVLYQDYRHLMDTRAIEHWEASRLDHVVGAMSIGDAIPFACARPDISFWVNADVADREYEVMAFRKSILVPSIVYFPKFDVSRQNLIEFVMPQLLWYGLHFENADARKLLALDPGRLEVLTREEQLVGTTSFRRDYAHQAHELRIEARQATRNVLERMLDSGQLSDGLESVDCEERLQFHLSRLRFLDLDNPE